MESGRPWRVHPNPNGMIFVFGFFIHQMQGHENLLDWRCTSQLWTFFAFSNKPKETELKKSCILVCTVACAVGPSVNTFFIFSHFPNSKFLNSAMWTHWALNWFFLPDPIFAICLNFQQQNSLKNQYLPHISFENCEINSIKSHSLRLFNNTKNAPKFQSKFQFLFYWIFIEKLVQ